VPLNPYIFALAYAVVMAAVIALAFTIFKTQYQLMGLVLAAIAGAIASLLPTIGAIVSLIATIGMLYWRLGKDALVPDIVVSVLVARLVLLPVLLLLQHR
jgi:hypothetical protein